MSVQNIISWPMVIEGTIRRRYLYRRRIKQYFWFTFL